MRHQDVASQLDNWALSKQVRSWSIKLAHFCHVGVASRTGSRAVECCVRCYNCCHQMALLLSLRSSMRFELILVHESRPRPKEVILYGDWNRWNPVPLQGVEHGSMYQSLWQAAVDPGVSGLKIYEVQYHLQLHGDAHTLKCTIDGVLWEDEEGRVRHWFWHTSHIIEPIPQRLHEKASLLEVGYNKGGTRDALGLKGSRKCVP